MTIIADKINSNKFSYYADNCEFVVEASSLPPKFNPIQPIWDDADDRGFVMVSNTTGKEAIFIFKDADTDASGEDIYGWNFVAEPLVNKGIGLKETLTALIIND